MDKAITTCHLPQSIQRLVVLRDHTNRVFGVAATVYQREQGPRRFSRKLDSEDGGEHPGEACRKAHRRPTCAWGRSGAIHGVIRLGAWPLRGAPTRTREKLARFSIPQVKIPESSTGVCISLLYSLASAFTLFA